MIEDPRSLQAGAVVRADLCIVGGGAAGITLAKELAGSGLSIVLLEGGAFDATTRSQALYKAEMVTVYRGRKADGTYPLRSRLRFFGGTTNHWRGWTRPLEAFDLEARDWIPHSGWPIQRAELDRWYARAVELVQVKPYEVDHGASRKEGPRSPRLGASERLVTRIFHYSPPTRFGRVYRDELVESGEVRLMLEANALRLRTNAEASRVEAVVVQAEDGPAFEVQARGFVLAAGGIENPRLLLLSDDVAPAGLGNDRDLVGRYFMDHPHMGRAGQVVFRDPEARRNFLRLYYKREKDPAVGCKTLGVWCLTEAVQRAEKLQNYSMSLRPKEWKELDPVGQAVAAASGAVDAWGQGTDVDDGRAFFARFSIRGEHGPNPRSRLRLGEDRDRLGLRKVVLDWRLTERDARSIRRSTEIFCEEVAATMHGRARITINPEKPWKKMAPGDHHIGTTRMSADASTGVVDKNCKLHGVGNLWLAGSSVFPSCGVVNPTLTIVALAARLAGHLREELGS